MQVGYAVPEVVTGKPISIGGSVFRSEATGAGVVMVIERACQRLGWNLAEQGCVVQGFGNVGGVAARELADARARRCSRSRTSPAASTRPDGLDSRRCDAWVDEHGSLADYPDVEHVSNSELLELPCDILVLAALEEQLTAENAPRVAVQARRRGRERADDDRGGRDPRRARDPVLPDILTNAGGVTVSYFEWVQDLGRLFWDRDEIRARLADKLNDAFDRVWDLSEQQQLSLRQRGARRRDPRGRAARSRHGGSTREQGARGDGARAADARRGRARRRRPGELLARPEVRAVFVCDGRPARRRRHAQDARPRGRRAGPRSEGDAGRRDRRGAALHDRLGHGRSRRRSASSRSRTLERVPVVEDGRLVGVLSRSVLQRRLAEDETARTSRRTSLSSRCRRPAARRPRPARGARPPRARCRTGCRAR